MFSELNINLIDVSDITRIKVLSGHKKAIIHLSFDICGDYLVSASTDGSVYIWDMVGENPIISKKLEDVIDKNLNSTWNISWNSFKGTLAFPGKGKQVVVMEKDTWEVLYYLKHEQLNVW